MTVDFQKLQEDVNETRQLVQQVLAWLKQPDSTNPPVEESPLNVQQAANFLDVTTATIYDLVHNRRIPNHRPGKRLYFLRSELMDWVKNGRRMTTDELTHAASERATRKGTTSKAAKPIS